MWHCAVQFNVSTHMHDDVRPEQKTFPISHHCIKTGVVTCVSGDFDFKVPSQAG